MAPVKTILILLTVLSSLFSVGLYQSKNRAKDDVEKEIDKIRVAVVKEKVETVETKELADIAKVSNMSNETEEEILRVKCELKKLKVPIKKETRKVSKNDENVKWLALNVYHEAGSEGLKGKMAVAMVTLNRCNHPRFPSSVKKVVQQKHQFSWYNKKLKSPKDDKLWKISQDVAELTIEVYNNSAELKVEDPITNGSQFYYASKGPNKIQEPYWVKGESLKHIVEIGKHSFYKI